MRSEGNPSREPMGGDFSLLPIVAAAHELKAPLALVRQLSLLLEQEASSPSSQELIQKITLTSERALRLTSDITKSTRLEDALFELEPVNAQQMCEEVIHELSELFEAHGRELKLKGRKHPLLLVANRDLLRRIIINFSDNALHYAADSKVHIFVQALHHKETVRIGVRDYGPALSSDMWRTLQDKLMHAPQSVHLRPQSSGLGLYLSGLFAEAMQGKIGALRHKDGATFYVDLQASKQMSLL
ncbi:MAG TPA: HAMP domain-containing sensor histidine kinase [Candidatus Saccharibacteria bacterium]|nr:HAMP domain-containing sensor histidine kinase [Candidatus Saccharibacteria bacterium]